MMNIEALLEEYVSGHSDKEKYVRTVVGIFVSHGIKEPTTKDYEETLRYGLQEKGIRGKSSYYNYKSAGKGFYEWLSTKGDKVMNEVIDAVKKSEHDTEPATESEVDRSEVKADTDREETSGTSTQHIMTAPRGSDADMATGVHTETQPHVQALSKRGRGRKPKPENENRTQISANISNEVYAGIKALAFVSQQPLSDLIAEILKAFYEDNHDAIIASVEVIEHSEIAKSKIKFKR